MSDTSDPTDPEGPLGRFVATPDPFHQSIYSAVTPGDPLASLDDQQAAPETDSVDIPGADVDEPNVEPKEQPDGDSVAESVSESMVTESSKDNGSDVDERQQQQQQQRPEASQPQALIESIERDEEPERTSATQGVGTVNPYFQGELREVVPRVTFSPEVGSTPTLSDWGEASHRRRAGGDNAEAGNPETGGAAAAGTGTAGPSAAETNTTESDTTESDTTTEPNSTGTSSTPSDASIEYTCVNCQRNFRLGLQALIRCPGCGYNTVFKVKTKR